MNIRLLNFTKFNIPKNIYNEKLSNTFYKQKNYVDLYFKK